MEDDTRFEIHITKKDLRKLYDYVTFVRNMISVELMGMFLILGMILLFRWNGWKRLFGMGLAALSAFYFITRLIRRSKYLQSIRDDAAFAFRTAWDRTGLTMEDAASRKQYPWEDIRDARETYGYFYLFLSEDTTLIIPKRDIPRDSVACCRELLIEELGERFTHGDRSKRRTKAH